MENKIRTKLEKKNNPMKIRNSIMLCQCWHNAMGAYNTKSTAAKMINKFFFFVFLSEELKKNCVRALTIPESSSEKNKENLFSWNINVRTVWRAEDPKRIRDRHKTCKVVWSG